MIKPIPLKGEDQRVTTHSEALAIQVLEHSSVEEREALESWASSLLELRESNLSTKSKAWTAIQLTSNKKVVVPLVKKIALELKRFGWDERSWGARFSLSGIALATFAFTGQGAGLAALGSAIGVPLWIVFGAGGAFAGTIIEFAQANRNSKYQEAVNLDNE